MTTGHALDLGTPHDYRACFCLGTLIMQFLGVCVWCVCYVVLQLSTFFLFALQFVGNDILHVYQKQQIKHRFNSAGLYIANTKASNMTNIEQYSAIYFLSPFSQMVSQWRL